MKKIATLLLLTTALALGACGRKAPDDTAVQNNSSDLAPVETIPADEGEQAAPPAPVENSSNVAADQPVPPPTISEDQQVRDDAEASGMTARLPQGEDAAPAPAENAQ